MDGPRRVRTLQSTRQACAIAYRWAMAFSTLGRVWAPLAFLTLPGYWLMMLVTVGRWAGDVVQCDRAAALIPNRGIRPARWDWRPMALAAAIFGGIPLLMYGGLLAVPRHITGMMVYWSLKALLCCYCLTAFDCMAILLRVLRYLLPFRAWKKSVETSTGKHVIVGSLFGAWPRGTGAGTALITYLQIENGTDEQALVGLASSPRVAAGYIRRGAQASSDHPLLIAWS
jgi:hypothetical protein